MTIVTDVINAENVNATNALNTPLISADAIASTDANKPIDLRHQQAAKVVGSIAPGALLDVGSLNVSSALDGSAAGQSHINYATPFANANNIISHALWVVTLWTIPSYAEKSASVMQIFVANVANSSQTDTYSRVDFSSSGVLA